jgi:hypothetical protein
VRRADAQERGTTKQVVERMLQEDELLTPRTSDILFARMTSGCEHSHTCWALFRKKFATFSTFFPSHHIKYIKRHMFEAVNVGKRITNYTVLMYFAT